MIDINVVNVITILLISIIGTAALSFAANALGVKIPGVA